jgi:hypothetical protein
VRSTNVTFLIGNLAARLRLAQMSSDHISKSKHWLERAAEMRTIAAPMPEDGIKASMLKLANDYDKLAARAIARGNAVRPKGDVPLTGSG